MSIAVPHSHFVILVETGRDPLIARGRFVHRIKETVTTVPVSMMRFAI
jgi:hypothetical protein